MELDCFECGTTVDAEDAGQLADAFLAHARAEHEWPYPDQGIRNYAEATLRLTGSGERLPEIGSIEVHAVTEARLDDWLQLFDHDGFVGKPEWAACYCLEPHTGAGGGDDVPHWRENRTAMLERLRAGRSFGYLAYVDGRPAGWVNASTRGDYALYRIAGTPDDETVGVSCFVIAPPYRRHGVAAALLDRVIADAPSRGARWVEAYPFTAQPPDDAAHFRGPRTMYDARGFEAVESRERDTVMRRAV